MVDQKENRKYNGWTNYETWAVNLWLGNDEATHRYWGQVAHSCMYDEEPALELARRLEDALTEAAPDLGCSLYSDLLIANLGEVDWVEIAEGLLEETCEGWQSIEESCESPDAIEELSGDLTTKLPDEN